MLGLCLRIRLGRLARAALILGPAVAFLALALAPTYALAQSADDGFNPGADL